MLGLFKKVALADGVGAICRCRLRRRRMPRGSTSPPPGPGRSPIRCRSTWISPAYSDMAIGLSRMFNIRLPAELQSPYRAASIIEFWRRWHISLSRFLRDYLYIPLGGNRPAHGGAMPTCWRPCCSAASGTAPDGRSSPGADCTAPFSSPTTPGGGCAPCRPCRQAACRALRGMAADVRRRHRRLGVLPRAGPGTAMAVLKGMAGATRACLSGGHRGEPGRAAGRVARPRAAGPNIRQIIGRADLVLATGKLPTEDGPLPMLPIRWRPTLPWATACVSCSPERCCK